jgi:hypothetical protein
VLSRIKTSGTDVIKCMPHLLGYPLRSPLSNLARVAANKRRPGRIEIAARKWPNIDEYSGHYGPVAECSQFILHVLGLICYD